MKGGDDGRLHSAVLVSPRRERRRDRRAREAAAKSLLAEDRDSRKATVKAKADELAVERRATVVLPKAGEPGPAALRTPGRLRLPRHQDTSATLAGAYPFLAEGGLGSDGVFVGQDLYSGSSFVYDPWVLYARGVITAPNLVLAGIVGAGKSALAKSLYTRSIPFGRRVYVPGDPAARRSCSGTAWPTGSTHSTRPSTHWAGRRTVGRAGDRATPRTDRRPRGDGARSAAHTDQFRIRDREPRNPILPPLQFPVGMRIPLRDVYCGPRLNHSCSISTNDARKSDHARRRRHEDRNSQVIGHDAVSHRNEVIWKPQRRLRHADCLDESPRCVSPTAAWTSSWRSRESLAICRFIARSRSSVADGARASPTGYGPSQIPARLGHG